MACGGLLKSLLLPAPLTNALLGLEDPLNDLMWISRGKAVKIRWTAFYTQIKYLQVSCRIDFFAALHFLLYPPNPHPRLLLRGFLASVKWDGITRPLSKEKAGKLTQGWQLSSLEGPNPVCPVPNTQEKC